MYTYIHLYIEKEGERQRESERERESESQKAAACWEMRRTLPLLCLPGLASTATASRSATAPTTMFTNCDVITLKLLLHHKLLD